MRGPSHKRIIGGLEAIEIPGDPEKGAIVLLHGYGANANDLLSLSSVCKGPTWIFPNAPLAMNFWDGFQGRAWFSVDIPLLSRALQEGKLEQVANAFPPDLQEAQNVMEQRLAALPFQKSQIAIGGFSQGALLATETLLKGSEKFAGLLIFSGTMVQPQHWERLAFSHAQTPFFQSHGTKDPILPFELAVALESLLLRSGFEGRLHPFQGGHTIPQAILQELDQFLKKVFNI